MSFLYWTLTFIWNRKKIIIKEVRWFFFQSIIITFFILAEYLYNLTPLEKGRRNSNILKRHLWVWFTHVSATLLSHLVSHHYFPSLLISFCLILYAQSEQGFEPSNDFFPPSSSLPIFIFQSVPFNKNNYWYCVLGLFWYEDIKFNL